eukprot:GFUD01056058.1.p1 GENE.GFUD01056058.1~~GFUD01056058.1.p1  ORF type:complete len:165 (-),score=27.05 GFUD01056058.1:141-635(-)
MAKASQLSGLNISNDLDKEVSDIQIISVISKKSAGVENSGLGWLASGWNYATAWSYVDTTVSDESIGNWFSREIFPGTSIIKAGDRGHIECKPWFNEKYRHYWMFKCNIGGKRFKIDKNNAQCNLWDVDASSAPSFVLHNAEGSTVRLTMIMNSGNGYFTMEEY